MAFVRFKSLRNLIDTKHATKIIVLTKTSLKIPNTIDYIHPPATRSNFRIIHFI